MIGRGSTPTITFGVTDSNGDYIDFSSYDVVNFYISNKDNDLKGQSTCLCLEKDRLTFSEDKKVTLTLTQEETLSLTFQKVFFQVRAKKDDVSIITNIGSSLVANILQGGDI